MKTSTFTHILAAALLGCALSAMPAFAQQTQDHATHGITTSGNPVVD